MPMDLNQQKEQFSNAYFRAVAAAAGYNIYKPDVDDSSVDWGIKGYRESGMSYIPQLELQLKCTADNTYLTRAGIFFDLKQKNYNDLCDTAGIVPRILVVVFVPNDTINWLSQTSTESTLKYCGFWHSLGGQTTTSQRQKRVHLDRTNVFSVTQLKQLMEKIGVTGGLS